MLDNIKLPRLNFSDLKLSELDINTSTAGLAAAGIVVILLVRRATQGPKAPLPPGPPRKPIVGNYLDLPAKEGWILPKLFRDLGRSFGSELVYANLCGAHVIVVNTAEAANDLFQHRANIYSSRPQLNALRRILGMTWLTAIMPSDDYWKATRKSFGTYFRAPSYHELETSSAHALLRALLKTPDDFLAHFRRMNTASTMAITYGVDMDEEGAQEAERYVGIGERVLQALVYGTSLFALAFDAIPALVNAPNWLLGGQFKRDAVPRAEHSRDMLEEPFKDVQRALAQGKAKPSVVYNMLSNAQTKEDEELAKVTGANVYFSGVNNMNSALGAFVIAMAKYPEAQKRAQAEIDAVVGTDRLPEFADHASLPFVEAIVKEVLRWKPVTPLSIPHAAAEEDVYKGYRIPKGAIVIGNSWAMLHDETTYPDPENFKPERWLTRPAGDFPFAAFGFGRRLCPGLAYVRDSLWITITSLLATYDIALAVDAAGAPIVLDEEWTPTLFSFPVPFKASITPRSVAATQLVLATASEGPLTGASIATNLHSHVHHRSLVR